MISKKPGKTDLRLYQFSTESLISFSPIRKRILQNLNIKLQSIEEIDPENNKLVIKTQSFLEVWDLKSEKLDQSIFLSDLLYAKYNRGMMIVFYQESNHLHVSIKDLCSPLHFSFNITGRILPYFCEIINKEIVICMINKKLLIINYAIPE